MFLKAVIGNLHSTTYEIQIETAKQARKQGFGIKEVPVFFINRKKGKSKMSAKEISGFSLLYLQSNKSKELICHRREISGTVPVDKEMLYQF